MLTDEDGRPVMEAAAAEYPPTIEDMLLAGLEMVWCFMILMLSGFNSSSIAPCLFRITWRGRARVPPYQATRALQSRSGISSKSFPRTGAFPEVFSFPPSAVRLVTREEFV